MSNYEREFVVIWNDSEALMTIQLTDEGIIVDVISGEEVVGTWANTAQELAETMLEDDVRQTPPRGLSGNYFPVTT